MSNLPINLDDLLAGLAKEDTSVERPSVSTIGTRAGQLTYNKQPIPNNKLDCIVIASTHANQYYEEEFDPDNIVSPVCYAYSADGKDMGPHPSSSKPQSDSCESCPQNKWGSAAKGRGKACKNTRLLGLIPADVKVEEVPVAEVAILKLPVMSVENYSNYVNKIATLYKRPALGMVTTISTKPNAKSQFTVEFDQVRPVENEMIQGLVDRRAAVQKLLEREYTAVENPDTVEVVKKPNKKLG